MKGDTYEVNEDTCGCAYVLRQFASEDAQPPDTTARLPTLACGAQFFVAFALGPMLTTLLVRADNFEPTLLLSAVLARGRQLFEIGRVSVSAASPATSGHSCSHLPALQEQPRRVRPVHTECLEAEGNYVLASS